MYPILFRLGNFTIRTYGVLIATAFLVGLFIAQKEGKRKGLGAETVSQLALYIIIGAIVGARLWHVAMYLSEYLKNPIHIIAVWHGGLAIQGGILGGFSAGIWFAKRRKLPVWKLADTIAPGIALGTAVGRWACFFSGDSYGKPTNLPWGITFTNPNSMIPPELLGVKLHPAQLYTSFSMLLVFGALWEIRKRPTYDGFLFFLYLILYSAVRFAMEFVRADTMMLGYLSVAQTTAVVATIISVIALWKLRPSTEKGQKPRFFPKNSVSIK
ncbi:MAG: prolipoprotein diacylglyceryl transferase [Candidatus Poribacteria bacterium]